MPLNHLFADRETDTGPGILGLAMQALKDHKDTLGKLVLDDIRRYEEMGISQLIVGFGQQSNSRDEMLKSMDEFATRVWPLV